jgi:methylated-DNA-protein-cysteine methyltransferase-like protein
VINAEGRISLRRADSGGGVLQRMLLEREGVRFDAGGRTDLERYRWNPRPRSSAGLTRRPTSVSRRERS